MTATLFDIPSETRSRFERSALPLKEAGEDWIGRVPPHWDVAPLYARYSLELGKMLDAKQITGEHLTPYLRNVDVQWDRINTDDLPQMDIAPSEGRRFILQDGDLLVCEGGEVGRCAIWKSSLERCGYQKALHRLRPSSSRECTRYLYYVFCHAASTGIFIAQGNPNTIPHLTGEQLRLYRFPFPPLVEQRQIADFLDRETARIDLLIAKKTRLIELLTEKRAAVVTHAVTKGTDPLARLKPSGVEWFAETPAHWTVCKTKRVAALRTGHTPSRQSPEYWVDCTIPWFSLADVWQLRDGRCEYLGETSEKISVLGLNNSAAELLPAGTVVVSRTASVGFSGIMPVPMATTQDFVNWVCGPRIVPEYLLYVFRSMRPEFDRLVMGSTHKTIYMPDVWRFTTPLPPLGEQRAIVTFIREKVRVLDELEQHITKAIDRLREYRSALITAAVTGRIDVRSYEGSR